MKNIFGLLGVAVLLFSCGGSKESTLSSDLPANNISIPAFNSDSAYLFVQKQTQFGPRVPNTPSHELAGDYLENELRKTGAVVVVQRFEATTFDHQNLRLRNIIASFNPDKQKRILLAAHWDTRPFADKDTAKRDAPFDGANDGASGVGVLLEVARHLRKIPPSAGVDLILFDGEDWGEKDFGPRLDLPEGLDSWWCLGSQYWSRHMHKPNYSAYFGILLDMVGAKGSHFFREGTSLEYAPRVVDRVWRTAANLGYSGYFVPQDAAAIIDDHKFINEIASIPMIDIVHYQPGVGYFGDYHHSRKDNLDLISKETLAIVGTVVMNVVYAEQ